MEVHKHPHHVTHKKKWGEYLLEFIMLFLAVWMGAYDNINKWPGAFLVSLLLPQYQAALPAQYRPSLL